MNVIQIAFKEMLLSFRNRRTLFFMLAFPLVLMLVLGTALANAFSTTAAMDTVRVLVQDQSSGAAQQGFAGFRAEMEKSGFAFTDFKPGMDGAAEVEKNNYDDYAVVTNSGIKLYGSDRNAVASNMTQGMLSAYADRYNAAAAIGAADPAKAATAFQPAPSGGYVKELSLDLDRMPGSMDYYAVALTVMIALWGAMSAANLVNSEIRQGTAARLVAAPVRKGEIFAGKVLGNLAVNMLCVLVVITFSKVVYHAYWGDNLPLVLLVLLSVVVLSTSLGLALSYLLKSSASGGLISLAVQLASFFGGAYFPLGVVEKNSLLGIAASLSPIRWANMALNNMIYLGDSTQVIQTIGLNAGLAALLLAASAYMMSKREGL
ncbi:ABC transporter permease [Paenibacillus humicus]|uniref:ABC transporter permease n=1 Tax=Paenibacillus humicus TaxID=412861 RepID=UPI000FD7147E|nr:ABC transporter permease [Paenibacillus humicus]